MKRFWIDVGDSAWGELGEQCVYLYCENAPGCTWRVEACGYSLNMLDIVATEHREEKHND